MGLSFYLINSMLLMALFIKSHVLKLLNKMAELRGNISIFLMLVGLYCSNLNVLLPFGLMLFFMLFFFYQ